MHLVKMKMVWNAILPNAIFCPSPFDLKSNDHREATVSRNENCLYCLLQNVTSYM